MGNQKGPVASIRIYDSLGNDITFPFPSDITYKTLIDSPTTTVTYVGKAVQGATITSSVWAIKQIDSSSITSIMLSPNFSTFGDKWSERASLTYS